MTSGPAEPMRTGSLARRFLIYQAERFPLARYTPLVVAFTFSAAAFSRLARGAPGFIPWTRFLAGVLTALVFFFMLRVLDEHKDTDTDRRYRPELPVPRGLVTLAELRRVGGAALAVVLALNAMLAPILLLPCLAIAGWAALMTREFFVRDWLRTHPTAYLISHMAIMPMIDLYTTGLDWIVARAQPSPGLVYFLLVTFLNGTAIEVGRKIRAPAAEREGVDTYTKAWGVRGAPAVWLSVLLAAALTAWWAARYTSAGSSTAAALMALAFAASIPAIDFLQTPDLRAARRIEKTSGLWTLASYLLLGVGPFLARWLTR